MSYATTNITVELLKRGFLERLMFSSLTTAPCCVFLIINGIMLFTLRSKTVFRETSRYILLYNLLFADTIQMAQSQLLYILAALRIRLTYPVCGVLTLLANLTTEISPITLVVMSLERYIAVCYPLRHAAIVTIRNTGVVIIVVWAFSSLKNLTQGLLLLKFPFGDFESLQMDTHCSKEYMFLDPVSDYYDRGYTGFLFISAAVVIICSYIGVILAARSASTDKSSAPKARNTLLLHMVQLCLSLSSTMYIPIIISIAKFLHQAVLMRIQIVLYLCMFILPRCLSALIYGLRDPTIRPMLMHYLCCRLKLWHSNQG